ncbi:hypothetical protein RRG08_015364 [Elysia crispata]|uniref:Proline-rich transmembrane protein 1 n=1 Tax=Elysia crispata TaxID=231223 RepID=A0AAE1A859_9GAST|nr:hypothetical protein RRG08_015364 [Elysia crispata]
MTSKPEKPPVQKQPEQQQPQQQPSQQQQWQEQPYPQQYQQDYPQRYPPQFPQQYYTAEPGGPRLIVVGLPPPHEQEIKDYLLLSILSFFCCWFVGVIAIAKSFQVKNQIARGDYVGAQAASQTAKSIALLGIATGIATAILLSIFSRHPPDII